MSLTKRTLHINPTKEEYGIKVSEKKDGGTTAGATAGAGARAVASDKKETKKSTAPKGSTGAKQRAGKTDNAGVKQRAGKTDNAGARQPAGKAGGTGSAQKPWRSVFGKLCILMLVIIGVIEVVAALSGKDSKEDTDYPVTGLPTITPPAFEDVFTPASETDDSSGGEDAETAEADIASGEAEGAENGSISEETEAAEGGGQSETAESAGTEGTWEQAVRAVSKPGIIWQTASSIAARKQFWDDKLMHYAGGQDDPYVYELISVTNLTGISDDYGNGVKYVYATNTGTQYYLYEDDDGFLECHWEPDGYSGSDSLERVPDNITENTTMIRMDEDQTSGLQLDVYSVSVFSGYYNNYDKEQCLAINLKTPLYIRKSDGTDGAVHSIQIYGEAVDQFVEERGLDFDVGEADGYVVENSALQVTGDIYEPDTNHHYTPVLMHVTGGM